MSNWKSNLIDGYRLATWPLRKLRFMQMRRAGKVPIAILFYHRVDNEYSNPWTISESDFEEQIDWYQKHFDLVDLEECQRRIDSGFNRRPTLSITFDDGYADNCAFALPLLIERRIPVTYFVTTQHPMQGEPFLHDVERGTPLSPNSVDALAALANAGVEIGGHTRSHADLGTIPDSPQLVDEVLWAARETEKLINKKIRFFAFPFGQHKNLNPAVFRMLKDHGFKGICSAYGGLNYVGGDSFHLQRLHGDPCFARIKNWLTFDPRLKSTPRYDYETAPEITVGVDKQSGKSVVDSRVNAN
jgi:peptidoglycan/xylan/chitin deacetylase (PgdA/CDA1 family)